jgi:threonine dehydratase
MSRISLDHIREAATFIDPVFLNSSHYFSDEMSNALSVSTLFKDERANPVGSFKGRGAEYFVAKNMRKGDALITASAGNFGLAMAYACKKRGVNLTVYASLNANQVKIDQIKEMGTRVRLHGRDFDEAKDEAKRIARLFGIRMVEDSFDVETAEGAGTIGIELNEFRNKIDSVLVPVGNGALISGVGRWFKHVRPATKIIAVQAAGAPAMIESWRANRLICGNQASTIADGIAVRVPIEESLYDMKGIVDDALLVSEDSIIEGMRLAHRHMWVTVEPSGAAGIAAILENKKQFTGQTVATILTGCNVVPEQFTAWLKTPAPV